MTTDQETGITEGGILEIIIGTTETTETTETIAIVSLS